MREKGSWTIAEQCMELVVDHALALYPNEACGVLIAPKENPTRITGMLRARNVSREDQSRRYLIDPLEFLKMDETAESQDMDICGFYHSHPDHPPVPSEYDRKFALEGYLYLIVSVGKGRRGGVRAWSYDPDAGLFTEVHLEVIPMETSVRRRRLP
ncbi:MAG: M67 family metallopeptidase [Deltaproteobacteria bacterium]|nr:M67 family metallopeptidase [Deltaproteobacteria bacterium]